MRAWQAARHCSVKLICLLRTFTFHYKHGHINVTEKKKITVETQLVPQIHFLTVGFIMPILI